MKQTFADIIKINPKFVRSINIGQDLENEDILKGFICPSSFRAALRGIADNVSETGQSAFTWTGPYGSGKSSLALLLSSLLGKNKKLREIASGIIGTAESNKFFKRIFYKSGWAILPVVGDVKDTKSLIEQELAKHIKGKFKDVFVGLEKLAAENDGLVLIIDEMGKTLEAAAKGIGEIYFFQQLAEFASRSNGKIIVIGILHQSFVDYARSLPHTMRDEWNKIQGRYIDTPINTAGEEQFELIGRAINCKTASTDVIKPIAKAAAATIAKNRHIISQDELVDSLCRCFPINPVVVCLLSQISRKKFGQNQRSIFSFLSSGEPYAFRDFINNTPYSPDTMYMPTNLFDYIKTNLESAIMASSESKVWHIATDAVHKINARGFSEQHLDILKSIAMIDLFNGSSGLVASEDLLKKLYPNIKTIGKIIKELEGEKVVLYKTHKNAYSVFEGSDFDIDAAFREAFKHVSGLETSKLSEIADFKPVIAKRYYHQYGAMRWFDVILTSVADYKATMEKARESSKAVGFFCVLVPNGIEEEKAAEKLVLQKKSGFDFPVVISIANNARLINENLRELLALEWIQHKSSLPGFGGDNVAQKVVKDRADVIANQLEIQMGEIMQESDWYYNGTKRESLPSGQLSAWASQLCEKAYPYAPKIKSELINKNRPSATANAALNRLLESMVLNSGQQDLGITGSCTEAGLLKILLQDTGLYQNRKGEFVYKAPVEGSELYALWEHTDEFLKGAFSQTAEDIFKMWQDKPLGIKAGLHTIFLLAYILTKTKEVAVYRDGIYTPKIDELFVRYLVKDPKRASLKLVKANDISNNIIVSVIRALHEISPDETLTEPLDVARKMVAMVHGLHPWVLKTKTLSQQTIKFREIVKSANDPHKLIFEDLPKLFPANKLYENVKTALEELTEVYPTMLRSVGILMTSELDIPLATPAYMEQLRERAKKIKGVSGNFGIDAFAARISTLRADNDGVNANDLSGIISLANNKPQNEWIDLDVETAKKELLRLCTEFKKAELYTKVKGRPSSRQAIAFIAGIGGQTEIISGDFDILTSKAKDVQKLVDKLEKLLDGEKDSALVLTALSQMSIDRIKAKDKRK